MKREKSSISFSLIKNKFISRRVNVTINYKIFKAISFSTETFRLQEGYYHHFLKNWIILSLFFFFILIKKKKRKAQRWVVERVRKETKKEWTPVEISESIFDPRQRGGQDGKWKETEAERRTGL